MGRETTHTLLFSCALIVLPAMQAGAADNGADASDSEASIAKRYGPQARRIIDAVMSGNDAWDKMEQLCDGIGHRLSGSVGLEQAVRWGVEAMKRDGLANVRAEQVMVPKWVRGNESATMLEPRRYELPMLGLGGSVATPSEGVTAEVVSVRDKKHLDELGEQVRGKIVLFNFPMRKYTPERGPGYSEAVAYRGNGALWASEYGAVAALVRSVTARSLRSPHTGAMRYVDAKVRIPTAAITIEDAEMITRLTQRGVKVTVNLKMEARDHGMAESANVIGELRGSEKPDEVVVIGGHLDSWDVGQGAHDDGGGCVTAMEALNVLRKLNLRPRRTIRVVLWTNEENGLQGGRTYVADHKDEMPLHVAAIEMDSGVFAPRGYSVSLNDADQQAVAVKQLSEIVALLAPLGELTAESGGGWADLGPMKGYGVPLLGHRVDMSTYFDYHHTHADTLDKIDPELLSKNVAAMAVMAYVLADMPGRLGESPAP